MVGIRGRRGGGSEEWQIESRRGSHASTPITRDSLTIGFPLAVTEIYRKPVHLVPSVGPRDEADSRFRSHRRRKKEIEARAIRACPIAER